MYKFIINDRILNLYNEITELYEASNVKDYLHHTIRVTEYCRRISLTEHKIVSELLIASSLIHDIGMTHCPSYIGHIEALKKMGPQILKKVQYTEEEISKIMEIARSHHPQNDITLEQLEQQILFDADNLELVGVFGILRWFGKVPDSIENLEKSATILIEKIKTRKNQNGDYFYTLYAKKIGESLIFEVLDYCNHLLLFCSNYTNNMDEMFPISLHPTVTTKNESIH